MAEHESAISRWTRARTMAAKVGKGLSKDDKAQKLSDMHWVEVIDSRHRYGHNLHIYYNLWIESQSPQPFFYWLDIGDGKRLNHERCPRIVLQHECIRYLGPKEREEYEVIVKKGKLAYKQNGLLVDTIEGTKWIFVLSTTRKFYVGQKKKGLFQHSSFLAGGAITSAGRLVCHNGSLKAVWPFSGHYCPTEESFMEFKTFLEEHHVDLKNVKMYALDDDVLPSQSSTSGRDIRSSSTKPPKPKTSSKRSTENSPHAGCVREYPKQLKLDAMEQVNHSPQIKRRGHSGGRKISF